MMARAVRRPFWLEYGVVDLSAVGTAARRCAGVPRIEGPTAVLAPREET
jgi:hypothetical protein